jgi:hypothetical protein
MADRSGDPLSKSIEDRMAASSELTQAASIRLLDELMQITLGLKLNVQSIEAHFEARLKGKNASGTGSGTPRRCGSVLSGFLESLPEKRRKVSMTCITFLEAECFRIGKTAGSANFGIRIGREEWGRAFRQSSRSSTPVMGRFVSAQIAK